MTKSTDLKQITFHFCLFCALLDITIGMSCRFKVSVGL